MKSRKDKYIPDDLYTNMKEILRNDWNKKCVSGINLSDGYHELTNYEISEGNIKFK